MSKKILGLVLVCAMVLSFFGGCSGTKNTVIIGNTTELSGDFRWPGFGGSSAGAADQDINGLITGYSTMETNQNGAYVWNNTVVKSHTEEEDADGNYVITIEINKGLKFSDGSEIKAVNYLAYVLALSTPIAVDAGSTGKAGQTYVGYKAYNAYTGVEADGASKTFKGVRLLDDYKFSLTVDAAAGYYPYYFAYTYGAVTPYPLELVLGEGIAIKDDGEGAYLEGDWYAKGDNGYAKAEHLKAARYDVTKYAFSGPYVIDEWDEGTKQVTLKINPKYAGNFEGQKPSIKTLVYVKIISETQLTQLTTGQIDILAGITGGTDTEAALDEIEKSNGKFAEVHYQRAGYGKVQFDCDFGPTMFASTRKAIAYLINTVEFAQNFTGGYGSVVYGPYSPDFAMWNAVKDSINLINYEYSVENAKQALIDDGWVYNSKGGAFVEGQTGVDSVRYKKLTAAEAEALNGTNKTYESVENTDGTVYKTVKVGNDYYMPLAINWFGTTPNDVTDMLRAKLVDTADVKSVGMVVRSTVGDFTALMGEIYRDASYGYNGTAKYGMFNLATGWNSSIYDYSFNWSLDPAYFDYSVNKLYDEYDVAFPYYDENGNHTKLSYADAMAASGNKLGMDYLSFAMVYDATTEAEYNEWWKAYIERWNQLLPDVPLYSNYYFDVYNTKIQGLVTSPFWSPVDALLYCTVE